MKKIIITMLVVAFLLAAYLSKPDDKDCIIFTVSTVWGNRTPDVSSGRYYEQFMDIMSKSVEVKDRVLFKQMTYRTKESNPTVAIGMFKRFFKV